LSEFLEPEGEAGGPKRDLRSRIQWCPLRSACPRWDSSGERCTCPFVEELWRRHPEILQKTWAALVGDKG